MADLKVVHNKIVSAQDSIASKHPLEGKVQSPDWLIPLKVQACKTSIIRFPKLWSKVNKKMIQGLCVYLANNSRAIALSSNQMEYKGKRLKKRFFVIKDFEKELIYVVLNPKILKYYGTVREQSEFCMSWIGVHEIVDRHSKIIVEYHTGFGEKITEVKYGREAQVWQHEIDHLNGKQKEMVGTDVIPNNLKISRNAQCPCGSDLKYKRCCGKNQI